MKNIFIFILALFSFSALNAQSVIPIRADTVLITKKGGNANLRIENATRHIKGLAINGDSAGTIMYSHFSHPNDSTYIIAGDTLHVGGGNSSHGIDDVLALDQYLSQDRNININSHKLIIYDSTKYNAIQFFTDQPFGGTTSGIGSIDFRDQNNIQRFTVGGDSTHGGIGWTGILGNSYLQFSTIGTTFYDQFGVYDFIGVPTSSDTTTYKPVGIDVSGNIAKINGWANGADSTLFYTKYRSDTSRTNIYASILHSYDSANLSNGYIGYGSAANKLTGTNSFKWDNTLSRLKLNAVIVGYAINAGGGSLIMTDSTDFPTSIPAGSTIYGYRSGNASLSGQSNVGFGDGVFKTTTSGASNSGFGSQALSTLTTGSFNIGVGVSALHNVTTGVKNIQIGTQVRSNSALGTTASRNILIGVDSSASSTALNNSTFVGNYYDGATLRNSIADFGQSTQIITLGNGGMTTTAYTALGTTATAGDQYYNKDSSAYIMYNGSSWVKWGGTGGSGVTSVSGTTNRITSTGGTTPVIDISSTFEALLGKVANRIDQNNAATTSTQFAGVISDETGTGVVVLATSPTFGGTPQTPNVAPLDRSGKLANTKYVDDAIDSLAAKADSIKIVYKGAGQRSIYPSVTGDSVWNKTWVNSPSINVTTNTDSTLQSDINFAYTDTLTRTLSNKRITTRIVSITSSATPTPNADITDQYNITALAANATIGAPTGTPTDGQILSFRIKDNATARTLAWNAIFRGSTDFALPSTTVISKTMYVYFKYNSTDTKWDCVGLTNGF